MSRLHDRRGEVLASLAHVLWATVFICGVELASNGYDRGIAWFGFVYGILPVSFAISIPYLTRGPGLARSAIRLAAFVTLLMAVVDIAAPSGRVQVGTAARVFNGASAAEVPVHSDFSRVRAIPTVVSQGSGGFEGVADRRVSYPQTHPRLRLALALLKLSALFVPLSIAGILPWLVGWIRAEIPNPVSATRAQFMVCWIGGLGLYWTVFHWAVRGYESALVGQGSLLFILLPPIALGTAGLIVSRLPAHSSDRQAVPVHHE